MPDRLNDENDEPENGGGDRDIRVDLLAEEVKLGRIQPQALKVCATCPVPEEVEPHGLAPRHHELPTEGDDQNRAGDIPDHLVQEQGLEQCACRQARRKCRTRRVDLQTPRQRRRWSEQLLVEVVAEPPESLRKQEPGHESVGESEETDSRTTATDVDPERPEQD